MKAAMFVLVAISSSGCVAWQSSIDDLSKSFRGEVRTLGVAIDEFGSASAEADRQFREDLVSAVGGVRSELVDMVSDTEARMVETINGRVDGLVTAEQARTLAASARAEALSEQESKIEALRIEISEAEKARLEAEERFREEARHAAELAEARAEAEALRVAQENEAKTKEAMAVVAEGVVAKFLGSETGAGLVGDIIRDAGAVTSDDFGTRVVASVDEYMKGKGGEGMDPETAATLGGAASLVPLAFLALRKLTEKQRYEKMLAKADGGGAAG